MGRNGLRILRKGGGKTVSGTPIGAKPPPVRYKHGVTANQGVHLYDLPQLCLVHVLSKVFESDVIDYKNGVRPVGGRTSWNIWCEMSSEASKIAEVTIDRLVQEAGPITCAYQRSAMNDYDILFPATDGQILTKSLACPLYELKRMLCGRYVNNMVFQAGLGHYQKPFNLRRNLRLNSDGSRQKSVNVYCTEPNFSGDGTFVVVGDTDGCLSCLPVEASLTRLSQIITRHKDMVQTACFSLDGQKIITAGFDETIRVHSRTKIEDPKRFPSLSFYHPRENKTTFWIRPSYGFYSPPKYNYLEDMYTVATSEGRLKGWHLDAINTDIGRGLQKFSETKDYRTFIDYRYRVLDSIPTYDDDYGSDDDDYGSDYDDDYAHNLVQKAANFQDDFVQTMPDRPTELFEILDADHVYPGIVFSLKLMPGGRKIVAAGGCGHLLSNHVRTWDLETGQCVQDVRCHKNFVKSVDISANGKWVVSGGDDGFVWLFNSVDHPADYSVGRGIDVEGKVTSVQFSPDNSHFVCVSGGRVQIYDCQILQDEMPVLDLLFTSTVDVVGMINTAYFSPDGRRIACASKNHNIYICSLVHQCTSSNGQDFIADGSFSCRRVSSGGPRAPAIVQVLQGHDDSVLHAKFSPDGRKIVSTSFDKTVRIWTTLG